MRVPLAVLVAIAACGAPHQRLYSAGTDKDEGHGELARASSRFFTSENTDDDLFAASARPHTYASDDDYGGATYGSYGGASYGGATYATYVVPSWSYPTVNRTPKYTQTPNLAGAIEGAITWRGGVAARATTKCGAVELPRIASDGRFAGVLVYVERVSIGRQLDTEGRPSSVGGTVTKRGCSLMPAAQVVAPLPAQLTIHGDAKRTRVKVTAPSGAPKPYELQEGGRIALQVGPGVTRVDSEDGTFGSAWVVGLETSYYALTDDRGEYRIDELSPGTYDVTIWAAPPPNVVNGVIEYGPPLVQHRTVKVEAGRPARLDVTLAR